ncbi:hypothetical protein [Clostridium beijerinckii]|uniref:Uncharacterized protein n=1 Tax=Clostridium beijerinckii TaxID=1520 RepID=A0A1S8SA94_CLOBE|nr:hypothetical protein [Clostridium beijerinckii]NRY59878.1 hypothetical protein [Clostridium beijerinckii]OOM62232.1 hypothetical protein CLBCK_19350 [Clostridium beijerinckii]
MQVNINRSKKISGYSTLDITNIDLEDYSQLMIALDYRLETLEEKLESYKQSKDERMKEFIPKTEKKILQLKNLIEKIKII